MRKTITAALVLLFLFGQNLIAFAAPNVGDTAPEITAREWLNTKDTVSLANLKGKIVVVEFWATWCPPCRRSIPHLVELNSKYKDKNLVIIGLTDENRKEANIDNFVAQMKMDYIVGTGSASGSIYEVQTIPHAFLIGPDGKIIWEGHPMNGLDQAIEDAMHKFQPAENK